MFKIKEFENAMKWGYPAFPFYTSVYFLLAEEPKRKYFTKWIYVGVFRDDQYLGYNSRAITVMGKKIIKELLVGKDGFQKALMKVLEEIHQATEICLEVKKNNQIRNINYWWLPGQRAFSYGANLIFGFDYALNEYIENLKDADPSLYKMLKSNIVDEKKSFLAVASEYLQSLAKKYPRNFSQVHKSFIKKYYWLQNSYLGKFNITEDWLKGYYQENTKKVIEADKLRIIPLDSKYKLLVEVSKLAIMFRDDRKKMFLILIDLMDEWLHLVCQDNGWDYDEMKWLTMGETLMCLRGDKKMLTKAKQYSAARKRVGLMNSIELSDIDEKVFNEIEKINSPQEQLQEFKGAIGNKGKIKGIAKVVFDVNRDGKKLNPGDILVTSMTRPEFMPLMSRAAAFVTDEGGITCHAGIVAREMNKPCIIGTKIATKVLHDGDMVEVDANKGIVKIIN